MEKWPIFDQNHGLTPLEISQFLDLLNLFFFFSVESRFLVLEYRKTHFPGLYQLKKKLEKWPFLDQKNVNISTFWTSCFYSLERRFFVVEYHKRYFSGLYCLKKVRKMAVFGPKRRVNPLGKTAIFRLFELLVFIA